MLSRDPLAAIASPEPRGRPAPRVARAGRRGVARARPRDPARRAGRGDPGHGAARRRAAAGAAARARRRRSRSCNAAGAHGRGRRPARRGDGAARGRRAGGCDRRDRRGRDLRQRRDRRARTATCSTGLDDAARDMNAFTDVWVAPAGSYDLHGHGPVRAVAAGAGSHRLPGVRAVRPLPRRAAGLRRAPRAGDRPAAPASTPLLDADQLVQGNPRQATARVRAGGWLVLSRALAAEHHLHIGAGAHAADAPTRRRSASRRSRPTSAGRPGAIVMNASDYARAWGSTDASAYDVQLAPGVSPGPGACARSSARWARASGLARAERRRAHAARAERAQPPGARAPDPDRRADPARRRCSRWPRRWAR